MIGKLKGILERNDDDSIIVDVGGVGYLVFCSLHTSRLLPANGEAASLLIETHVREDHIHLYGFVEEQEREWFRTLTTVKGVGTKMALAILSVLSPARLITAIIAQDKAAFTQISGVGPKLADRLLTELKSKVKSLEVPAGAPALAGAKNPVGAGQGEVADAISALINLGYNRSDAYAAVQHVAKEKAGAAAADLVKLGLKELVS